jgi:hypothetical protein
VTAPSLKSMEDELANARDSETLRRIKERLRPHVEQLPQRERQWLNTLYATKKNALLRFGELK